MDGRYAVSACHTDFEFIILGTDVRYSNRSAIIERDAHRLKILSADGLICDAQR